MSLSVIPLVILGQITGASVTEDASLYQVTFKDINGDPLYGVTAVWTDEQAEIEALAAEKPYGVWINPIDGTFTVKFAGYTYVGTADLTDADVLAGVTPIEFNNEAGGGSDLPDVTAEDNGKYLVVNNGIWSASEGRIADYTLSDDLQSFINGIILSAVSSVMTDYKWHRNHGHIGDDTRPEDYEELIAEIRKCTSATVGSINGNPIRAYFNDNSNIPGYEFYSLITNVGLVHILVMFDDYQSSMDVVIYARREEIAS